MKDGITSIVLIEDDEDDYVLTRDLLAEIGKESFDLKWVSSYHEALAIMRQSDADVYLIDYRLGANNGLELLREALDNGIQAPVILLTGKGNREVDLLAMQSGASDYLVKGEINSELLDRAIRYAIERKQAEMTIKEAEARFRMLVEQLPLVTYQAYLDPYPQIVYVSPQIKNLLGYHPAELTADSNLWIGRIHPEDREMVTEEWMRFNGGSENIDIEYRMLTRGGLVTWVHDRGHLVRRESMIPGRLLQGGITDISERRRSQERIRSEKARAESMVRTAARFNSTVGVKDALSAVCEETTRALGVYAAAVHLTDEGPGPHAAYFSLEEDLGPPLSSATNGTHSRTGRDSGTRWLEAPFSRSMVLGKMGRPMGMLTISDKDPDREWGEDEEALFKGLADQATQAIENARLLAQTRLSLERMQALHSIEVAIISGQETATNLESIVAGIVKAISPDAVALYLSRDGTTLSFIAGRGFIGQGIPGLVLAERAARNRDLLLETVLDPAHTGSPEAVLFANEGIRMVRSVPLLAKGVLRGVLQVMHRHVFEPDAEWVDFLDTLCSQVAAAIDNILLFEGLQISNEDLIRAYDATIEGWSRALDLRDEETEGHTKRVTDMTIKLASAMGLDEDLLVHVKRGALLHDIGKMGVPDSILLKPGPLTDDEWAIMKRHPGYALEMLEPIQYLRKALDIPHCHHEKWDGTGYPRGLSGNDIPLVARIFSIVDVWDALSSNRPYRSAWPPKRVREYLIQQTGKHFDPKVVASFLEIMPEE